MKLLPFIVMIAFAVATGCGPVSNLSSTIEQPVSIKVECRNEMNVRNQVLQLLRSPKAKDLALMPDGDFIYIQIVFIASSAADLGRIDQLEEDLKRIPGVLTVDIQKPVRAVQQTTRIPYTTQPVFHK